MVFFGMTQVSDEALNVAESARILRNGRGPTAGDTLKTASGRLNPPFRGCLGSSDREKVCRVSCAVGNLAAFFRTRLTNVAQTQHLNHEPPTAWNTLSSNEL
jgi:hypothetical protein